MAARILKSTRSSIHLFPDNCASDTFAKTDQGVFVLSPRPDAAFFQCVLFRLDSTRPEPNKLTRIGMPRSLGDGPVGVALGQVAPDHDLLPLVLEGLRHGPAGDGAGLVEGLCFGFGFGIWFVDSRIITNE
jgi:hypothetical protein